MTLMGAYMLSMRPTLLRGRYLMSMHHLMAAKCRHPFLVHADLDGVVYPAYLAWLD
jgi:hypothetical protein